MDPIQPSSTLPWYVAALWGVILVVGCYAMLTACCPGGGGAAHRCSRFAGWNDLMPKGPKPVRRKTRCAMFHNREEAAQQLARKLMTRKLHHPLVLAIPRGGVVVGATLARDLGAELDVVLSRKLRAPGQPELALGAIHEDGQVYLHHFAEEDLDLPPGYLAEEREFQLGLIARRKKLFRAARPKAKIAARSVIVTDDGIATGSTMIAALETIRAQKPKEVIVAVPVAPPERLHEVREHCDDVVCLLTPRSFWAIGQFYEDFSQVGDDEVITLLRSFAPVAESAKK